MEALSTGISGLDEIMCGGLRPKSLHLIYGPSGAGKTILAQQMCFYHGQRGETVLYLTALSETVENLVAHLESLSFLQPSIVAQRLFYLSLYSELQNGGLPAVLNEIRRLVREYRASLIVIDGLRTLKSAAFNHMEFRRFLFDLNGQLRLLGATTVFLSAIDSLVESDPEATVADGIIHVGWEVCGSQIRRFIEIPKLRNVPHLTGRHSFTISENGLTVYPRLEAIIAKKGLPVNEKELTRLSVGVSELDRMTSGGLPSGSVTMVAGECGSGRTLLGMSFLSAGIRERQKGLYLGFHESPDRLIRAAAGVGIVLNDVVASGDIVLSWHPLLEPMPDMLVWHLLTTVKDKGVERVVLDGLGELVEITTSFNCGRSFIDTTNNVFRGLGVTVLMLAPPLRSEIPSFPHYAEMESSFDNVLSLRYLESRPHLRRLVSIVKMRESEFDSTEYEFTISKHGLDVTKPYDPGEASQSVSGRLRGRRGDV